MHKNYYQILGLENNATKEQIKKAYRIYATKFHPDKQNGDNFFEERFKEIQEAYEILIDDARRKNYNASWEKKSYSNSNNSSQNQSYRQNAESKFRQNFNQYQQEQEEKHQKETQETKRKKEKIFYTSKNLTVNAVYINIKGESLLLENYDSSTIRKDDNSSFVFIGIVLIIIGILTLAFFVGPFLIVWGIYDLFYKEYFVVVTNEYGDTPLIKGRKNKMKRISNRINKAMNFK